MSHLNVSKMSIQELQQLFNVVHNTLTKKQKKEDGRKKLFAKTEKQKASYKKRADQFQRIKADMVGHIIDHIITHDYYNYREFIADPTVYLDSAIMGNYINNQILIKSIIAAVKRHFELDLKEAIPF